MKSFVREKRTVAGNYMEIDLYVRTEEQERACRMPRKRKNYISRPSQNNWNDKKSRRYAKLLIYANFRKDDYYLTLTYDNEHLPDTPDQAKKDQDNYLRKLKRLYEKQDQELKYMWFTSYQFDDDTGYLKRIHHHVLINGTVDRDLIEDCWSKGRGKSKEKIGRTDCRRIQPGKMNELEELANYLTDQEKHENGRWKKGQKRWSSSKNLVKPYETKNDYKWSQRKLAEIGRLGDEESILAKLPGNYRVIGDLKAKYTEETGWYVKLVVMKMEDT